MLDFKLTQPETQPPPETEGEDQVYDLIILGGGPAGLTAALYAGRARVKTLVLAGSLPGGQPMNTDIVENYPGFHDGIDGPELGQHFVSQAKRFDAEIVLDIVTEVDFSVSPFMVKSVQEYASGGSLMPVSDT